MTEATPALTAEEYARLKEQAQCAEEYRDRLLRLQAEFDNTRKRMAKEQLERERRAGARVLVELLGVVDDFERALVAASGDTDPAHVRAGLEMIYQRISELLRTHGVQVIETIGQPFDPARHEAVAHVTTTGQPADTIVQELRKGYTLHGCVIRPATVQVAVSPSTGGLTDVEEQGGS